MKRRGAAIGTFDGLHLGHKSVVRTLVGHSMDRGLEPVVITFDRHPLALIAPEREPDKLSTDKKRISALEEAGVTPLVVEFNESLRNTTAEEWLKRIKEEHGVALLVIGYDNTFGSDGVALSIADYKKLGLKTGVEIIEAPELEGISSSEIRKAVKRGDVKEAARLLGRFYSIEGEVVGGNSLGRQLGFPTANIRVGEKIALPVKGVYAGRIDIPGDGRYPAMINIGNRPTVSSGDEIVMEVHAIGWSGDIYGKTVAVEFIDRLRDEQKFDTVEELKRQLDDDREKVLKICNETKKA